LNFHVRTEANTGNLCKFPLYEVCSKNFSAQRENELIDDIFNWFTNTLIKDEYGIVGLSHRMGNNRNPLDEYENTRTYAIWGINLKYFREVSCDYDLDGFTYKGDLYTFIFMLSHGLPNLVSFKYCFGRTAELMKREAELLKSRFPNFISIREKPSKSWGGGVGETITDVIIQWKKAYDYGVKWLNK
jgi:hypothetical protein